jgi:DNA end-binding protein Ku
MWKGVLRLGDERVPVKLFAAAQDTRVHFHLLHAADGERVRQRLVHPDTGDEVAGEDVRRGLEVEKGTFVVLTPDELETLEPPASREVEVRACVPREAIPGPWYDRPYWLGPDDGEEAAYFALAHALERAGRVGVCRFTMRKKAYAGALGAVDGRLSLVTLHHAGEVLRLDDLRAPPGRALDRREVDLARQLVQALEGPFEPAEYRDEHRARVLELVRAKARGEAPALPRPRGRRPARSLSKALEASLRRAKESRVA